MTVEPSRIAQHLDAARRTLDRIEPSELDAAVEGGALVVDIRPESNRREEGELPGSIVVERIHLEWRLDPTSPDRIPEATSGRRVIIVCNEGYSSSLAAQSLRTLGVDATDLVGGYRALPGGHAAPSTSVRP
jgi:rhodanese-related sulfurtransferase